MPCILQEASVVVSKARDSSSSTSVHRTLESSAAYQRLLDADGGWNLKVNWLFELFSGKTLPVTGRAADGEAILKSGYPRSCIWPAVLALRVVEGKERRGAQAGRCLRGIALAGHRRAGARLPCDTRRRPRRRWRASPVAPSCGGRGSLEPGSA